MQLSSDELHRSNQRKLPQDPRPDMSRNRTGFRECESEPQKGVRRDVAHPWNAIDLLLQRIRDSLLCHLRVGASIGCVDLDQRIGNIWQVGNRQHWDRDKPDKQNQNAADRGQDRSLNEIVREGHRFSWLLLKPSQACHCEGDLCCLQPLCPQL